VSDVDALRKEARFWLKHVRAKHSGFTKRLRLAYPAAPAAPTLRDIQHALARERGYENWKALVAAIGDQPPPAPPRGGDPASNFLGFACWDHLTHGRGDYATIAAAAMRLLDKHPEIASADIYTAAVCGNRARVEQLLNEQPLLADRKGGLRNWEPLLYLCYARLPLPSLREQAVPIARLLLDRGANPNAYYMAGHSVYGALVGVAGDGEQDAPPHSARDELYELLLQRGAEPYDIQVLYNTHFRGDVLWWLKLTWEYSAAASRDRDWADADLPIFDMGGYGSGARFLLWLAIQQNNRELAEWLLERGANPNAAPPRASTLPQMSLHRFAALEGRQDIADLLRRHGATPDDITGDDEEAFMAACMRLDRHGAAAMAKVHPEYLKSPRPLFAAAQRNRADVVALLLDLGVPVNTQDASGRTALHAAAGSNALDAAALLLERDADVNIRETQYRATPMGFASHYDHRTMIDILTPHSRDVWCLANQGKLDRLRDLLAAEPQRAREIGPHGLTLLWHLPNDEDLALQVVELLLAYGVDPAVKGDDGTTAADSARALGLERVAARLNAAAQTRSA
jgi:ankyrin repeat protein